MERYRENKDTIRFLTHGIILEKENKQLKEELKKEKERSNMLDDRRFRTLINRVLNK